MKQAIYSLDLKDLKEHFESFCEKQRFTSSQKAEFIRDLIRREIDAPVKAIQTKSVPVTTDGEGGRKYIRMSLDSVAYDTLVLGMKDSGFKSLPPYVESLSKEKLNIVGIKPPTRQRGLPPELMSMFSESNGNLHVVQIRVRSITDQLKTYPEYVTATQLELMTLLPDVIRQHTLVVAKALASLNPQRRIKARKGKLKE